MGAAGPWRPFVFRRRGRRATYELLLAGDHEARAWTVAGVLPRDPRAPRTATEAEPEALAGLWAEGIEDETPTLVWDTGHFRCEGDFERGLRRGKLRIELRGYKLRGTWALGRQKGTWRGRGRWDASNQWDITAVPDRMETPRALTHESVLSGRAVDDASGEKRRAHLTSMLSTLGAKRGAVPWREPRELPPLEMHEPFTDPAWLFELRRGGRRALGVRFRGRGHLVDETGTDDSDRFPLVCRALASLPLSPLVLDGELVEEDGLYTLWAFDVLAAAGKDLRPLPLVDRKRLLEALLAGASVVRYVDHLEGHGEALCDRLESGDEAMGVCARRGADAALPGTERVIREARDAPTTSPRPMARGPIRTSNRDKIFWPDAGLTKGQLLDYYEAIAPTLLPYIAERPLVLTRFPDGISGRSFFQHHAPGAKSAWLKTVRIKTSRRWRDYFICESASDLLYLVNLGTIELHGWPSRADTIERPDWCTIDIDRSEASRADVARVARSARALCESLGLPSFVKTSGGDGLHVVIPLGGKLDYDASRILAELLSRTLAAENSDIATIEGTIAARDGKVYLDYLVNARGRMLAVPYGVRARPGAPVSTPVSWEEVTESLDPREHTIETVAARVRERGDLWREMLETEADVPAALERLGGRMDPS